ncbi:MAG TPA: PilZ domain-containing protein [Blastocatellia bacterium]|nr:PilZ domain-containing protein [Blastocatellia bacterium]
MSAQDSDRRRAPRAPLLREVEIDRNGKVSNGRVVDLSVTGAFIETGEEFRHNDDCRLSLTLPGGKQLNVDSIVCYIHSGLGIGVEFRNLTAEEQSAIEDCVAKLK